MDATTVDKEKNYSLFIKKLSQLGIDTSVLDEKYGEKIKNATFMPNGEYGCAFEGSFLEVVLKTLTPFAVKINDLYPEDVRLDKNQVVKVAMLHQVAKCIMLVPNDNEWEISKLKRIFKYTNELPSIKTGLLSLSLCQECGIPFTLEEVEAMVANDRDSEDPQYKFHAGKLSQIIRSSSEMTYLTLR